MGIGKNLPIELPPCSVEAAILLEAKGLPYLYLAKIMARELPLVGAYGTGTDRRGTERTALSRRTDHRAAQPNPFRALGARRHHSASTTSKTKSSSVRITAQPRIGS